MAGGPWGLPAGVSMRERNLGKGCGHVSNASSLPDLGGPSEGTGMFNFSPQCVYPQQTLLPASALASVPTEQSRKPCGSCWGSRTQVSGSRLLSAEVQEVPALSGRSTFLRSLASAKNSRGRGAVSQVGKPRGRDLPRITQPQSPGPGQEPLYLLSDPVLLALPPLTVAGTAHAWSH